jgi:hypothetical protein
MLQFLGTHPTSSLCDPPGNVVPQHDVNHKIGHLTQEASQATLVDMHSQAIAKAQESHHTAPADATVKQTVGKHPIVSGESKGALKPAIPFPPPQISPIPLPAGKLSGLAVNPGFRGHLCPASIWEEPGSSKRSKLRGHELEAAVGVWSPRLQAQRGTEREEGRVSGQRQQGDYLWALLLA